MNESTNSEVLRFRRYARTILTLSRMPADADVLFAALDRYRAGDGPRPVEVVRQSLISDRLFRAKYEAGLLTPPARG